MTPGALVLVVEDDPEIRRILAAALDHEGLAFTIASDADQGWRALHEVRPDALILDLLLPGRHGLEFLRDVRGDPATRRVPVLVLSARDTEMDKLLCFEHGADD